MTIQNAESFDIDLSDLPAEMDPKHRSEIAAARRARRAAEDRKLTAEAELRTQKSLGARYKDWAQDDSIGVALAAAFVPRGKPS